MPVVLALFNLIFLKMIWFSSVAVSGPASVRGRMYLKLYLVALHTALETNPGIIPFLIYNGPEFDLINLAKSHGCTIIKHSLSIERELRTYYNNTKRPELIPTAIGAFSRIDIPLICKTLEIKDEYVLYTDNDVMFIGSLDGLHSLQPKYFNISTEWEKEYNPDLVNSGVLWLNWGNLVAGHNLFSQYVASNLNNFKTYDQDAIKMYYKGMYDELSYNYNYKPYWEESPEAKIIHFHGPKPTLGDFPPRFRKLNTPHFQKQRKIFNRILSTVYGIDD